MLPSLKKSLLVTCLMVTMIFTVGAITQVFPLSHQTLSNLSIGNSAPNLLKKFMNSIFQKRYYIVEDGPLYKKLIFEGADSLQVVQKDKSFWVSGKINFPLELDENSSSEHSYTTQRFYQLVPSLEGLSLDQLKIVSLPNKMIIQFSKPLAMSM